MATATILEACEASNTPSVSSLPRLLHEGVPVITSEALARAYETEPVRIRQNFHKNRNRFEAGKHFFVLSGPALKDLRVAFGDSQICHPRTRNLTLWTERGAARHAKILDTDRAWDVFEMLEDNYFRRYAVAAQPPHPTPWTEINAMLEQAPADRISTAKERHPLTGLVNRYVGMLAESPSRELYKATWSKLHDVLGIASVEDLRVSQLPQAMAFFQALIDARAAALPAAASTPALPEPRPHNEDLASRVYDFYPSYKKFLFEADALLREVREYARQAVSGPDALTWERLYGDVGFSAIQNLETAATALSSARNTMMALLQLPKIKWIGDAKSGRS